MYELYTENIHDSPRIRDDTRIYLHVDAFICIPQIYVGQSFIYLAYFNILVYIYMYMYSVQHVHCTVSVSIRGDPKGLLIQHRLRSPTKSCPLLPPPTLQPKPTQPSESAKDQPTTKCIQMTQHYKLQLDSSTLLTELESTQCNSTQLMQRNSAESNSAQLKLLVGVFPPPWRSLLL